MAANIKVCTMDEELADKIKRFRTCQKKTNAALVAMIDTSLYLVKEDTSIAEELEDMDSPTLEEVAELLPAHLPRYLIYRKVLNHSDGRVSYPICFIYISPSGSKPDIQMMYAGSKLSVVKETSMTKVFEVRSVEELTEDWLLNKLSFF